MQSSIANCILPSQGSSPFLYLDGLKSWGTEKAVGLCPKLNSKFVTLAPSRRPVLFPPPSISHYYIITNPCPFLEFAPLSQTTLFWFSLCGWGLKASEELMTVITHAFSSMLNESTLPTTNPWFLYNTRS